VSRLLENSFTRLRLYTDGGKDGPANETRQQTMFGTVALPLYAIVSPNGQVISQLSGSGHSVLEFAAFLQNGIAVAGAESPSAPNSGLWLPYNQQALAGDARAGRPAIVDFTATWCTNCHALERNVFPNKLVVSEIGRFGTYRADLTNFYASDNAALEKQYGILQLPAVLFLGPQGREVPGTRVTGVVTAQDFARRMAIALRST
jgi:thiol:disulfide interchange protein DsbD